MEDATEGGNLFEDDVLTETYLRSDVQAWVDALWEVRDDKGWIDAVVAFAKIAHCDVPAGAEPYATILSRSEEKRRALR